MRPASPERPQSTIALRAFCRCIIGGMKCPICAKPVTWQDNPDRPFCSERCRIIDLGNWAAEEYRVPIVPQGADEDEMPQKDAVPAPQSNGKK